MLRIPINNFLFALVFFVFVNTNLYAQVKVSNADFQVNKDGTITITYELKNAIEGEEYNVELFCTPKNDSTFTYNPQNLIGDVGNIIFIGGVKKVLWRMSPEEIALLKQLKHEEFIFKIEVFESGGIPWYYWAGGAGIIGAIIWWVIQPPPPPPDLIYAAFPGRPK